MVTEARRKAKDEAEAKKAAAARDKGKGKHARAAAEPAAEEDLRHLRGKVDMEELEDTPVTARRRRRAAARVEAETGTNGNAAGAAAGGPVTIVEGMTVRDLSDKLGITAKDRSRA